MDNKYILTTTGTFANVTELYHHGINGMKWGVRRYQNADGSLTAAGRKRYLNSDGTLNNKGKKKFGDSVRLETLKKKTVKDMTDEELNAAIIRARKEDEYNRLRPETTQQVGEKTGKKFMTKIVDEMVVPALVNSGKKALEAAIDKTVKNALADKIDPDSYEALKNQYDKLKIKKDIADLKSGKKEEKELTWDEKLKKQQWEKNERERAEKEAKAAEEQSTKSTKNNNDSTSESTKNASKTEEQTSKTKGGKTGRRGVKWDVHTTEENTTTNASSNNKSYNYTVDDIYDSPGRSSNSKSSSSSAKDTINMTQDSDGVYRYNTSARASSGKSYVSGLLSSSPPSSSTLPKSSNDYEYVDKIKTDYGYRYIYELPAPSSSNSNSSNSKSHTTSGYDYDSVRKENSRLLNQTLDDLLKGL